MLLIYRSLVNILFPLIIIIVSFRTWIKKEDKKRYKEKLFASAFKISRNYNKKLIWFHVASIGELKSIIPLIKKLNNDLKFDFLITSVTLSSAQLFFDEFKNEQNITHRFFPIDKSNLVNKFLNSWFPNLVVFIDSEVWPNFLLEINKRKIPLILLNGRITQKTFLKWNLIPKTAQKVFRTFDKCFPASNESKKYLEKLNVKNIKYFGNLKLTNENKINNLSLYNQEILNKKKIWCAVSTHEGEDVFCLKTHLNIKKRYKNIVTIIIPRHINKAKKIKLNCEKLDLKSQILSDDALIKENSEIIIINSYGVISKYLNFCKSVFMGKSMLKELEAVSGQNPIEAARLGCKIYHGPYVYNFKEIYQLLNQYKISEEILDETELSNKLIFDLNEVKEVNRENVKLINNLGNEILNSAYDELIHSVK